MLHLLHTHWLWVFGALALGIALGWITYLLAAARWTDRPVHIAIGAVALGVVLALSKVVPARYGYWLELGVIFAVVAAIGCFIGWALRDLAEFRPASAKAGAVAAGAGSYLFRRELARLGAGAAYMRAASEPAPAANGTYLFREEQSGRGAGAAYMRVAGGADGGSKRTRLALTAGALTAAPVAGGYTFPKTSRPKTSRFADATADHGAVTTTGLRRHWTSAGRPATADAAAGTYEFTGSKGGYVFPTPASGAPPTASGREGSTRSGLYRHWTWRNAEAAPSARSADAPTQTGRADPPGARPVPSVTKPLGSTASAQASAGSATSSGAMSSSATSSGAAASSAAGASAPPSSAAAASPPGSATAAGGTPTGAAATDATAHAFGGGTGSSAQQAGDAPMTATMTAPGANRTTAGAGPSGDAAPRATATRSAGSVGAPAAGATASSDASPSDASPAIGTHEHAGPTAAAGPSAAGTTPQGQSAAASSFAAADPATAAKPAPVPTPGTSPAAEPTTPPGAVTSSSAATAPSGASSLAAAAGTAGVEGKAASASAARHGPAAVVPTSDPPPAPPVPNQNKHPGNRPDGLAAARNDKADDLKRIRGIGPQNEGRLHGLGIWHFDQIAAWTRENVEWVGSYLAFPGRIDRERWIEQATALAAGQETEFSRRVAASKVTSSRDDGSLGQSNIDSSVKPGGRGRR